MNDTVHGNGREPVILGAARMPTGRAVNNPLSQGGLLLLAAFLLLCLMSLSLLRRRAMWPN